MSKKENCFGQNMLHVISEKSSIRTRLRLSVNLHLPNEKKPKTESADESAILKGFQRTAEEFASNEIGRRMKRACKEAESVHPFTSLNSAFTDCCLEENSSITGDRKSQTAAGEVAVLKDVSLCCSGLSQPSGIRFQVKDVKRKLDEVHILLQEKNLANVSCCTLHGFWVDTLVKEEDTVNVLAPFVDGHAIIDNNSGLLVVNPDRLVSSTAIVSTLFCKRKSVLAEIFRGCDSGNFSMVLGNLVHRLFQTVLVENLQTEESVQQKLDSLIQEREVLFDMYSLEKTQDELLAAAQSYIPEIVNWVHKHCSNNTRNKVEPTVTQVVDIEESIWSPRYGLKGKIDATLRVAIGGQEEIIPLELKTGKASFSAEHRGQVILYTMMMGESHPIREGLLLYLLGDSQMQKIASSPELQRGLIQMRNDLGTHLNYFDGGSGPFLPDPINLYRSCSKCPFLLPCTVLHKSSVSGQEGCMDPKLVCEGTKHLNDAHLRYFFHWFDLLRLEHSIQEKCCFWTQSSEERESQGNCFSSVVIARMTGGVHTFKRHPHFSSSKSFCRIGFSVGDAIIVSIQDNPIRIAVATGTIQAICDLHVDVLLERDLELRWAERTFRLDRSPLSGTTNFWNLMQLLSDDSRAVRLRRLVVDQDTPVFDSGLSRDVALRGRNILRPLNLVQQRAVLRCLMAKDYLLIRGMPGTGKTSTIVAMVRLFVALGRSVLLTSYTHSAVDNILLKLKSVGVSFLRLGMLGRIHPELQEFTFDHLCSGITSVSELDSFFTSQLVVAATCFGVRNPLFTRRRRFDVCIVDEASQVLQVACLGPLFHADKFCLFGDTKQLPPVVQSKEAREIVRLSNELTYNGALKCGSDKVACSTLSLSPALTTSDMNCWWGRVLSPSLEDSVVFCNTDAIPLSDDHSGNSAEAFLVECLVSRLLDRGVCGEDIGVVTPFRKQVHLLKTTLVSTCSIIEVNTIDQYQGRDKSVIILSCVRSHFVQGDILEDEQRLNVALTRARHKLIILGCKSTLLQYLPFARLFQVLRSNQTFTLPADCTVPC